MKIKICGIKNEAEATIIKETMPHFAGFVFAKTKRFITYKQAKKLREIIPSCTKTVGVFVDTLTDEIIREQKNGAFEIAQLHGNYTEEDILKLKKEKIETIKVIRVQEEKYDIKTDADFLLFDTYVQNVAGGTNKQFNWNIEIKANVPYFIAGGINEANIMTMAEKLKPYGADVSSGVEVDGFKTKEKVSNIIKLIKESDI